LNSRSSSSNGFAGFLVAPSSRSPWIQKPCSSLQSTENYGTHLENECPVDPPTPSVRESVSSRCVSVGPMTVTHGLVRRQLDRGGMRASRLSLLNA
jgi:hypothetical protein